MKRYKDKEKFGLKRQNSMFLIYKNHLTKIFEDEIFKFTYFRFTINYSELLYNVIFENIYIYIYIVKK